MEEDKTREPDEKIEQATEDVKELTNDELENVTGGFGVNGVELLEKRIILDFEGVAW